MCNNFFSTIKKFKSDVDRYTGGSINPVIIIAKGFHNPGMIFSFFYRFERYLLYESNFALNILGYIFYPIYFFITYYLLSYHIEPCVNIDRGLFLHNRDIIITNNVKIGKNFSIMGQTTIGTNFDSGGIIKIGDDVSIGAGAKIIASNNISIADRVSIGANAVVTKSILEENCVYGGVPAVFIKYKNDKKK